MMLWPWQKITIGLMRVSVHHWRRLCSHWNCNNAQMIETLLYSLQGYPQVLETGVSPALCQTFLLWGTSNMGKFSMEKSRQLTNRVAPFAELNSVLGIHGRNISVRASRRQ